VSFRRAGIQCACYLAAACTSERAASTNRETSPPLRSESSKLSLPSDPKALAATLGVPTDSLRVAGEERYARQEYDSARAIWRVELTRAEAVSDSIAVARVRMWLGLAAWRLGDFKSARFEGERSLSMKRRLHMVAELARSFNALGLLAWQEGRLRDALQHFDSAKASASRNHDSIGVARAVSNIPLVQIELGDFDAARKGFVAALAAGKGVDDDRIQGNALANLGMLESRLGNATRAVSLLGQARSHYRTIDYGTGESNALGQLAIAWSQLGDLQHAIAAADSALVIAKSERLQQEVAAELEVLADLQMQAGSPRLALRSLAEADSIDKAVGLKEERGTNLRRIAAILTELGEYPAAIARAHQAAALHREVQAETEVIYDRLQLAQSLSLNHQPSEARVEADSAALEARRTANPSIIRAVAAVAARLALDSKDPERALTDLRRAGSTSATDWRIADLSAEALLALGRLNEARREGERAISVLEHERGSLGAGPLRSLYLASRSSPFSHLIEIHLARHDTSAAFSVAASLPGRDLSERFAGFVDAPRSLIAIAEGERLLLRAATLEQQLDSLGREAETAERANALEHELTAVRSAYEEYLVRRAALPEAPMLGLVPVRLDSVKSRVREDEAVVLFLSGPDRLDVFVVRRRLVQHTSVPLGDRTLAQRVRLARELLGGPQRSPEVPKALGDLYDLLLGPAERTGSLAGVKRLLIVPHGSLGAFPFGALWNRRTGRFLIEERVLSYLPAISALTVEPPKTRNRSDRLVVFAPLSDSLPGTEREARAIANVRPGTELRIGSTSTEAGLKTALLAGASVHVASHGSHNSQNPLFSRMIVGRTRRTRVDDGHLDVHEILGLQTTSPLVFLSGCETGLGSGTQSAFERGSEEGSLAQAFLIAGAQTVVATLWRVDDAGSIELAKTFYRQIRLGASPSEALATAQRAGIKAQSGYSWGAYAVSGMSQAHR
jgi:CHAT domain-containing protein/tetratricopeptide (TPR) repeat protein